MLHRLHAPPRFLHRSTTCCTGLYRLPFVLHCLPPPHWFWLVSSCTTLPFTCCVHLHLPFTCTSPTWVWRHVLLPFLPRSFHHRSSAFTHLDAPPGFSHFTPAHLPPFLPFCCRSAGWILPFSSPFCRSCRSCGSAVHLVRFCLHLPHCLPAFTFHVRYTATCLLRYGGMHWFLPAFCRFLRSLELIPPAYLLRFCLGLGRSPCCLVSFSF